MVQNVIVWAKAIAVSDHKSYIYYAELCQHLQLVYYKPEIVDHISVIMIAYIIWYSVTGG